MPSAIKRIWEGHVDDLLVRPTDFISWYPNPTLNAVMLHEALCIAGVVITLEEVTGFGMSSWPQNQTRN